MPFVNGKYREYTAKEKAAIEARTSYLARKPRIERALVPGETMTALDYAVYGDIFPVYVVEGSTKTRFPNRAAAEAYMASALQRWESEAR